MLKKEEIIYCPLCSKQTDVLALEEEKDIDENLRRYWEICPTCKEIMAEGVTLRCLGKIGEIDKDWKTQDVPCCTVTVVTKEILEKYGFEEGKDFEVGGVMDTTGCPVCSSDKSFHFGKA